MLIVVAALLAVLLVPLLGGRLDRLTGLRLRCTWLVPLAFGLQILVISVFPRADPRLLSAVHIGTYLLALSFTWLNRAVPGLVLLGVGAASNGVTIALNDGVLPASAHALARSGFTMDPGEFTNSGVLPHPVLPWLGDVLWVPAGWPLANVFSIGDLLIVTGLAWLLHRTCGSRLVRPLGRHAAGVAAGPAGEVPGDRSPVEGPAWPTSTSTCSSSASTRPSGARSPRSRA